MRGQAAAAECQAVLIKKGKQGGQSRAAGRDLAMGVSSLQGVAPAALVGAV